MVKGYNLILIKNILWQADQLYANAFTVSIVARGTKCNIDDYENKNIVRVNKNYCNNWKAILWNYFLVLDYAYSFYGSLCNQSSKPKNYVIVFLIPSLVIWEYRNKKFTLESCLTQTV